MSRFSPSQIAVWEDEYVCEQAERWYAAGEEAWWIKQHFLYTLGKLELEDE